MNIEGMEEDERICAGCCGVFDQSEMDADGYCPDCSAANSEDDL